MHPAKGLAGGFDYTNKLVFFRFCAAAHRPAGPQIVADAARTVVNKLQNKLHGVQCIISSHDAATQMPTPRI